MAEQYPPIDVAAYYWPAYHDEPRWRRFFPQGEGEWYAVKNAKPGRPGHNLPRVPLWGYQNEADPIVMARKIRTALAHHVNVMIFDWYWFDGQPFLEDALNEGYLKAPNCQEMKFYLMWANHDAKTIWNHEPVHDPQVVWPGAVDRPTFDRAMERVVDRYLTHPAYYRIDGKPVFAIYDTSNLIDGLGGVAKARAALDDLRAKVQAMGFDDLHLQLMLWGKLPASLGPVPGDAEPTQVKTLEALGVHSVTNYQWCHLVQARGDYATWGDRATAQWDEWAHALGVTYFPHVSIDWDTNARRPAYDPNTIEGSTPDAFAAFMLKARRFVLDHPDQHPLITVNAWNEWSEGSYLEPDMQWGYGYLEALKKVMSGKWDQFT